MNIRTFIVFLFSAFYLFTVCAEVHEIKGMGEIQSYISKNQLIIFDIDNTILEPIQELGSYQWFTYRIQEYQKMGMDYTSALNRALPEWVAIQNITKVKPVENHTPKIIKDLQQKKYQIMALTTRGLGIATRTIEQLSMIGIDLSLTSPLQDEKFFMNEQGILFRKGVLFTAGTHKGNALKKFLSLVKEKPKSILFINDKMENIKEVEFTCEETQLSFTGLRYSFLDEKVKKFRKDLVEVQFDHFGHILSDEAAEAILENSKKISAKTTSAN